MRRLFAFAAALALLMLPASAAAAAPNRDAATTTPIKHIVMLMQDNHSFDNYFGTYPGADGIPSGACQRLSLTDPSTRGCVKPFHIGNLPADDLSQAVGIQKRQYDGGKMDGFIAAYRRLGIDGTSAMGYYDGADLPYYWNVADQYVLFDHFFSSTTVGSRESYLYWLAGNAPASAKPLTSNTGYDKLPTIFDRLEQKGVSARFYVENLDARITNGRNAKLARSSQLIKVPLLSMKRFQDGGPLSGKIVDLSQYDRDLRSGNLPAVSYIVTSGSSENPPTRVGVGQQLVEKLTSDLIRSPYWASSAFMWTYDGWGGWFDHVRPPAVDARGYGFRVPALLISPYARKGVVDHTVLDYTSMLSFIETNWQVKPLASRDTHSAGLASAFDFTAPPRSPALISSSRFPEEAPPVAGTHVTSVIYGAYGGALVAVTSIVALTIFVKRRFRDFIPAAVLATFRRRPAHRPMRALADYQEGTKAWVEWYGGSRPARPDVDLPLAGSHAGSSSDEWVEWYRSTHGSRAATSPRRRRAATGRSRS